MDELIKCKHCGKKIINHTDRTVCKNCQARIRNFFYLYRWIGKNIMGYPPEEIIEQTKKELESV